MDDTFSFSDDFANQPDNNNDEIVKPSWLDQLNEQQKQAVTTTQGALLVLSGAGTGKTKVLTSRLSYILATRKASPWNCLAVTFTNKAAREMTNRVYENIGEQAKHIWLGTFHRLCLRILRTHANLLGLDKKFIILDADDQQRMIKRIMQEEDIDVKKYSPNMILSIIQRWKDKALTPEKTKKFSFDNENTSVAHGLYEKYQKRLKENKALDFGDLLLYTIELFQKHKEVLEQYQLRFKYILVDEYQDTNVAQYLWLRLLAQKHKNICCVGDDDQSIYSWRGAEVGNILRFENDFENAKIIKLETNYRSSEHILNSASNLIAHNKNRLGKSLKACDENKKTNHKVNINSFWDGREEARQIIEEISELNFENINYSQMAILVRTSFQMREFEENLIDGNIPYRVIGGPKFYERMEIRDALAYIRLYVQSSDNLAFDRIVNKPKRGLGKKSVEKIRKVAVDNGLSFYDASCEMLTTDDLGKKAKVGIKEFIDIFENIKKKDLEPYEVAKGLLEDSGYIEMLKADKGVDAQGRLENLEELINSIKNNFSDLMEFLEHVSLVIDNDEKADGDRLSLMTLHAAKGLEFEVVFLPGWEEGLFPHNRSIDEAGISAIEEERRLAHVGITRAKKRVYISFASNRMIYGNWQNNIPSRFIDELPRESVDISTNSKLYNYNNKYSGFQEESGTWSWYGNKKIKKSESFFDFSSEKETGFKRGDEVIHKKFGQGIITHIEGQKLEIKFKNGQSKKIMASFVSHL